MSSQPKPVSASIGRPLPRREDERFLAGAGCFTDDLHLDGEAHGVVVHAPHAHARVLGIDARTAQAMPGVLAVYTAADLLAAGLRPLPCFTRTAPYALHNRDGSEMAVAEQWALARDRVRHTGEPVAFVVASTREQAQDAAECVAVDYEPLPAVVETDAALDPGAPRVWDACPGNLSFDYESGDRAATDAAFAQAARVVRLEVENNRVVVAFMEPRAAIASYDPDARRYTLYAGSQSAHGLQAELAEVLGVEPARLHVIAPDTGGGFGARTYTYPEFALVAFAARRLARPVRWTAERSESFVADTQARDQRTCGEIALDAEGRFLGVRISAIWRHGAYLPSRSLWVLVTHMAPMVCGVYAFAAAHFRIRGVFTNTVPLGSLRGVARAETAYVLERLVDAAARELGLDRVELRRRNLVPASRMPWTTPAGAVYDSGDFERNLDGALAAAQWRDFPARRQAARRRRRLRGIGLSLYIENSAGAPAEYARIEVAPEGIVTAYVGTKSFGMGHETTFAQVLADELGVPLERLRIRDGDTALVAKGFGSHGSRSMRIGGTAVVLGARKVIERGKELAADLLEAAAADIVYAEGRFAIAGTDRRVGLFEVAAAADARGEVLDASAEFRVSAPAYPNGCHVCELEVDPETGHTEIVRYVAVIDAGRVVNPLIAAGQVHGGLAQGIGQALLEHVVYDPQSGQLLSGNFLDYAVPRADDLPSFTTQLNEIACADNPLGVKGLGENPTTGSPPAVMNALIDALAPSGVTRLEMPATPERIWRALRDAQRTDPGDSR